MKRIPPRRPDARPSTDRLVSLLRSDTQLQGIEALWCLRLMILGGLHKRLVVNGRFACAESAAAMGFDLCPDAEDGEEMALTAMAVMRSRLQRLNRNKVAPSLPPVLAENLHRLGEAFGLDALDQLLLAVAVLVEQTPGLRHVLDLAGHLTLEQLHQMLAWMLDVDVLAVAERLGRNAPLHASGLLEASVGLDIDDMLSLPYPRMAARLSRQLLEPADLLSGVLHRAPPAELCIEDFAHLREDLPLLLAWFKAVNQSRREGCNVLIYGPPGTGKTQFARVLAEAVGSTAHEVACCDEDGSGITGAARLCALRSAQIMMARTRAVLVFDELEDAFGETGDVRGKRRGAAGKAWMHQLMETNKVPTLWIGNQVDDIDEATLRRFDVVLHLPVPTQALRERILQRYCGQTVEAATLRRLSQSPAVSPALVSRAARVIEEAGDALPSSQHGRALERLLDNTLAVQGKGRIASHVARHGGDQELGGYRLDLLNADTDLDRLVAGIQRVGQARICLYGAPGTGKSGFGRWLAQQLERPLQVCRVSDLVSKYVGETERAIADAFSSAEAAGSVLMFDEVDSFLSRRADTRNHWEVTQVNEMLTQMEAFSGVCIASTNALDRVDEAALRRFDMKVGLGALRPHQLAALFEQLCERLGLLQDRQALATVSRLSSTTPGDFAAVERRARFSPFADALAVSQALVAEIAFKQPVPRPIGFVGRYRKD